MSAATDTIARNAAQIAAARSQERQQIEALRSELAAVIDDHARATADAALLAGALDAATRENAALLRENASLRAGRALALMALDTLPSTDVLPEEGRALLAAATAHNGLVEARERLARQWPAVARCVACGAAHDVQACPDVIAERDADPIPGLHADLAAAETAAERNQIVARIALARAEAAVVAARRAL